MSHTRSVNPACRFVNGNLAIAVGATCGVSNAIQVSKDPALPTAVKAAAKRVSDAERALTQARAAFRQALRDAHESGMSQSAIARALGVTRQRVKQMIS
jgi:DNA-directed RNA polymerase specialized sigma24 family protein